MFTFFKKTSENIARLLGSKQKKINKEILEEILIESDIHYEIIERLLSNLGNVIGRDELRVGIERFFRGESYYDKVKFKEHSYNQGLNVPIRHRRIR